MRQKRSSSFSAAEFGEALCKRFRSARLSLLARVDAGSECIGASSTELLTLPKRQVARLESPVAEAQPRYFSSLERFECRSLSKEVDCLPPGDLHAELLRPLPPSTIRRPVPAPKAGKYRLWDIPRPQRDVPECVRPSTRVNPMSYLEYLSWLQRVLPESMQPVDSTEDQQDAKDALEEFENEHLTALDLLRRLSVAARPPSPPRRFSRVPSLTAEEHDLATSSLDFGSTKEVLISRFNVELTRGQLACLKPGQWLNDEVINFYCQLLEERGKKSSSLPKCWFPNSFFWPKLSGGNTNYSFKDVKRWTIKKKIDIFELDYIIFPMNICESHWALGAIDRRAGGFRYFDSMFCRPHKNFVPFLQRYLQDEHKAKKGKPLEGIEDWDLIDPERPVPKQDNGYDCGVFTCFFADCFSAGRELAFDQEDMPDLRLRIAARVVAGKEDFAPIPIK